MQQFNEGDRVVFHESETGEAEHGSIEEVIPADEQYPNGGLYIVRLDADLSSVEAFHVELTFEDQFCKDNQFGDHKHQVTDGSCDCCGAKNFN
jgi:hypothetical protein